MDSHFPTLKLRDTYIGHRKPVNVVKFHPTGQLLLSGGEDGQVNIWDLESADTTPLFTAHHSTFGAVFAATWAVAPEDSSEGIFVIGTTSGRIFVYAWNSTQDCYKLSDYQDAHDSTIDDLAFDPVHRMLASSGNGEVHIRTLTTEGVLQKPSRSIPRVLFKTIDQVLRVAAVSRVFFTDRGKTFVVLYRENHLGVAYQVDPWQEKWDSVLPTRIGLGTLSSDNYIVVTNLNNGVDVYNVPPRVPIASVSHPMVQNFPVQVSSLDKGLVVVGSEDGFVTLWNWRTDEKKRFSHNGSSNPVQVVDSISLPSGQMIATASSGYGPVPEIKVWKALEKPSDSTLSTNQSDSPEHPPLNLAQLFFLAAFFVAMQKFIFHLPFLNEHVTAALKNLMDNLGI